jgi:hypothetical protein
MKKIVVTLAVLVVALAALLVLTRESEEVRWETLRVYPLSAAADAPAVAVAVPSGWREIGQVSTIGSSLRFVDASGREVAIPRTELQRAAVERRVYRPAVRTDDVQVAGR